MPEAVPRLLLPGTLCDARVFAPMHAGWSALDGRAWQAPGGEMADLHTLGPDPRAWCAQLLERLPVRFDAVGFSLGGVLALMLLDMAPERVRRLVLVSCNSMPGTASHQQRVQEQQQVWRELGPRVLAERMLRQAAAPQRLDSDLLACVQDMAQATPDASFQAQGQLNATRPDGLPALARWAGPLMLLNGADDPWCGADKQARIRAARLDASWHEIPGAGHYLPLECPVEVARLTHHFLC